MDITVEMSLYPLDKNYIPVIKGFIAKLNTQPGLTVVTNAMSTQVRGEFDLVTGLINDALKTTFAEQDKVILVCKYINGALPIDA